MKKIFKTVLIFVALAVILVFLYLLLGPSEQTKSPNTIIKGDMSSIRAQAEIVSNETTPKSYSQLCINQTVVNLLNEANKKSNTSAKCFNDEDSYVVASKLQPIQGVTSYFCVDSTNVATEIPESRFTAIVNANTFCQ